MSSVMYVNADRHDYVTITQDALDLTAPPRPQHVQTCSTWTSLCKDPPGADI